MLAGLQRVQGRALVVIQPGDAAAYAVAEAFLRTLSPGAAAVTSPSGLAKASGEFGAVAVFCSNVSQYFQFDMAFVMQCLERLRPGGHVLARLGGLKEAEVTQLETQGLYAGAVDSRLGEQVRSKGVDSVQVEFSCLKPSWAAGAAAALPNSGKVQLIDEDALLGEVPEPVGKGKSDCSSQPKACANCSCGRKELEDKVGADEAKKRLEQGKERSACGSCYLGDAFRCETCPYRGLPAFKPGTKVELSSGETEGSGQFGMRVDGGDQEMLAKDGKVVLSVA
uniref:Anamorsin homolog n=1 Tax=Alexandrium catenella TaxID=2925 RepID=A0A7S1WWR9_ALECA|mmetsp:Transcript_95720/g.254172  ORF Transcript_95720/g.254172 Transcript_95720/m.254172 type:complete len:281 (+) Transcript_95720:44-886(+)